MTSEPLALCAYARVMPGGQLINRLRDRGYRVVTLADPQALVAQAERHKPLIVFVDLEPCESEFCRAVAELREHPATAHMPVVVIVSEGADEWRQRARSAGATLVVNDKALTAHLDQFLEQALDVN